MRQLCLKTHSDQRHGDKVGNRSLVERRDIKLVTDTGQFLRDKGKTFLAGETAEAKACKWKCKMVMKAHSLLADKQEKTDPSP